YIAMLRAGDWRRWLTSNDHRPAERRLDSGRHLAKRADLRVGHLARCAVLPEEGITRWAEPLRFVHTVDLALVAADVGGLRAIGPHRWPGRGELLAVSASDGQDCRSEEEVAHRATIGPLASVRHSLHSFSRAGTRATWPDRAWPRCASPR